MRIVFVDNLLLEVKGGINTYVFQPHLGLISLIAVAESVGHEGLLYDPKLSISRGNLSLNQSLYRDIANEILVLNPDVVGLTSLGCNFICTVKVASYLKAARPYLPILLGGPHATVLDRPILEQFPQFDVIVRNEAEMKILPLLESLPGRCFRKVPGITYRDGPYIINNQGEPVIADLDSLPRPAYYRYPIKELNLTWLRVEAGRGCPFHCTFCSTATFFGRQYRLKSSEKLCAELDYLNSQYGITRFSLSHDLFTVNRKKVIDFCTAVSGRGYTWKCSARMDCVDPELLDIMYDAGCREIYYGVETGSVKMQKIAQKRLDLSLFDPILEATEKVGMSATISFITGYPQEEQIDQDQTLDLLGSCFHHQRVTNNVQLHLLTPEPGTNLIDDFGNTLKYDGHISDFNFPTLEPDDPLIMKHNPDIFMNHHYYPSVIPRKRHVFVTSVYQIIYNLGFPVLSHLLDMYEQKLSILFSRMFKWAEQRGLGPPFNGDFICSFMEEDLGKNHYLTSLTRYLITASQIAGRIPSGRNNDLETKFNLKSDCPSDKCDQYTLSPNAAVLRELHNCPQILQILAYTKKGHSVKIPKSLRQERQHFLLFYEDSGTEVVRNFILDETSATLLEYFKIPHSFKEYTYYHSRFGLEHKNVLSFFKELIHLGILQQVMPKQINPNKDNSQYIDIRSSSLQTMELRETF